MSNQQTLRVNIHSEAGTDEVDEEGAAENADQTDVDGLAVAALESVEAAEVGAGLVAEYRRVGRGEEGRGRRGHPQEGDGGCGERLHRDVGASAVLARMEDKEGSGRKFLGGGEAISQSPAQGAHIP